MTAKNEMNIGVQPLDGVMVERGISNHDLVAAMPPGFITHKQVQKARKGRRLTPHMQDKIVKALNTFSAPDEYEFEQVFNYRGKKGKSL